MASTVLRFTDGKLRRLGSGALLATTALTPPPAVPSTTVNPVAVTAPTFGLLSYDGRYFVAPNGKRVFLVGPHEWAAGQSYNGLTHDTADRVSWLQSLGANATRYWLWLANANGSAGYKPLTPPLFTTTAGVADLTTVNPAFLSQLLTDVRAYAAADIYCIVPLAGNGTSFADTTSWASNPFKSGNNSNGINGDPNSTGNGTYCYQQTSGAIYNVFKGLMQQIVSTLKAESNVLYEFPNEIPESSGARAFISQMLADTRAQMSAIGSLNQPIMHSAFYPVTTSNADSNTWAEGLGIPYSLAGTVNTAAGNNTQAGYATPTEPAADGAKPVIYDTDHVYGGGGDATSVFDAFTKGYAGYLEMESFQGTTPAVNGIFYPGTPSSSVTSTRTGIQQLAQALKLVDLTGVAPVAIPGRSGTGAYALSNPSTGTYLAYLMFGGSVTLDLSGAAGQTLGYRWLDLSGSGTGAVTTTAQATAAAGQSFTCPTSAGLLIITAATSATKSITLNSPGNQTPGNSFTVTGTLSGYSTVPTLSFTVGGGAPQALSNVTINSGVTTFSATVPGQAAGTVALAIKDAADNVTSNTVNVLVATPSGSTSTGGGVSSVSANSYGGGVTGLIAATGAILGSQGAKAATISGTPTGTVPAGQPLSPAGTYTLSGVPSFGTMAYAGLYNKTLGFYEFFHTGYNLLYPLAPLTATSGALTFPNPTTGALQGMIPDLYNGGGTYVVRICSDQAGRYVLRESAPFTVSVPALNTTTTSIYPPTLAGATGNGPVLTVGPGKTYATVSNAIEAINLDLAANPSSHTYWDAVLLVDPAPSNANYYLNDCYTGSCASSTAYTGDSHYSFKGQMPNVPLTIRGNLAVNGQRPTFIWNHPATDSGKGFWLRGAGQTPVANPDGKQGYPLTLENLHFVGDGGPSTEADGGGNFPCIGMQDALEGDLQINNCLTEYFAELVVGGNKGAGLYVRNSTTQHCGNSGQNGNTHTVYVGELSEVVLTDSLFCQPGYLAVGHHIKSRAFRTILERCRIQDGSGNGTSYVCDFPQGGEVTLDRCVLHHGPGGHNAPMLRHGEETNQTASPGQPVFSNGFNGFPYFYPGSLTITNSWLLNEMTTGQGFGDFFGVLVEDDEPHEADRAPHAVMSGTHVYGTDATTTYFRGYSGNGNAPFVPPDPAVVQLASLPTLDFSQPPATGQADPTVSMPTSGTVITSVATGGSVSAPTASAQQLLYSSFNVTLTGGKVGWVSLITGGAEEGLRVPSDGTTGARLAPVQSGTYSTALWNAATGGQQIGTGPSFTVAAATPLPVAAPANLAVVAAFSEMLIIKHDQVSGTGTVYYCLGYRTGGGAWKTAFGQVGADGKVVYTFTQLAPSTTFEVAAVAIDDYGTGTPSGSIFATTAAAGTSFTNNTGPWSFSGAGFPNGAPTNKPGGNNGSYASDIGKFNVNVAQTSNNSVGPSLVFFLWSTSAADPSVNPYSYEQVQTLTAWTPTVWYDNDIFAGPTGQTCYPWVLTSDGYCYLAPLGPYAFS